MACPVLVRCHLGNLRVVLGFEFFVRRRLVFEIFLGGSLLQHIQTHQLELGGEGAFLVETVFLRLPGHHVHRDERVERTLALLGIEIRGRSTRGRLNEGIEGALRDGLAVDRGNRFLGGLVGRVGCITLRLAGGEGNADGGDGQKSRNLHVNGLGQNGGVDYEGKRASMDRAWISVCIRCATA